MSLHNVVQQALHGFALCLILTLSLFSTRRFRILGHSLVIRALRMHWFSLSLFSIKYTYKAAQIHSNLSFSSSHIHLAFHLPRPSCPTILILTLHDCNYTDSEHTLSFSKLSVVLSIFPTVTRVSAGPFLDVTLDDFRIRIFSSRLMPKLVEGILRNLTYTILNGDTFRLDDLATKVVLCTIGGKSVTDANTDGTRQATDIPGSYKKRITTDSNGVCANSDDHTHSYPEDESNLYDDEEAIVSLTSSQWHIKNVRNRHYTFGSVSAQLRHSWDSNRRTCVLIAKECTWIKIPRGDLRSGSSENADVKWWNILWQVLFILLTIPSFLLRTIYNPGSSIDLHLPRVDVTFDLFRLRDAELMRQGWIWARKEYVEVGGEDMVRDMIWDAILTFLK